MAELTLLVVAGVVRRAGRFLIARRAGPGALAGMWEFPGGKIHPGESPEDALCREWREEFGMEVAPVRLLGETDHRSGGRTIRLVFVEARCSGNPRFLAAHDASAWVRPSDVRRYRFAPADMSMVRHIHARGVMELPKSVIRRKSRRSACRKARTGALRSLRPASSRR